MFGCETTIIVISSSFSENVLTSNACGFTLVVSVDSIHTNFPMVYLVTVLIFVILFLVKDLLCPF